ncbi:ribosome maturation factor [Pollutibacter soli]|uniref:ribosome maturation factor n=1 Tax=Pollutibacter soli TaxID=3034157 RepID=UPI003013CE0B
MNQILAADPAFFLVDIKIKPVNNIRVYVDGDQGITIEKCISINRALYKTISESGLFPGDDFSLEVSSPGLDEPLKMHRQYVKNSGRTVEVIQNDGKRVEGLLKQVEDSRIFVVEEKGKNKKKEVVEHIIPFDQIKTTKIQIVF